MATNDFKLLQKVQDMMEYAYPALAQFPKAEKFSLAQDIRNCMNKILELTIVEEKRQTKRSAIENLDVENTKLKHYVRLAMKLKILPFHKYEVWTGMIVEIGKMIGGLMKSVSDRPKT